MAGWDACKAPGDRGDEYRRGWEDGQSILRQKAQDWATDALALFDADPALETVQADWSFPGEGDVITVRLPDGTAADYRIESVQQDAGRLRMDLRTEA